MSGVPDPKLAEQDEERENPMQVSKTAVSLAERNLHYLTHSPELLERLGMHCL